MNPFPFNGARTCAIEGDFLHLIMKTFAKCLPRRCD